MVKDNHPPPVQKEETPPAKVEEPDTPGQTAEPGQLIPYRFSISEEKGKKALVRFRENLRHFYPDCKLTDGLRLNDNPVLELYCYDPKTEIGYCRLSSAKHDGPIFKSPKQLYETYNCSSQGHPNDVFVYSAEGDEDHGKELTAFLKEIEILTPDQFSAEYLELFQDAVRNNVLLNAYPNAIKQKRSAKKETKKEAAEGQDDQAPPVTTNKKKRTGRPKTKTEEPAKSPVKKLKPDTPPLIPTGLVSLQLDEQNFENSTATFTYQRQGVRLGDLPEESVERSTICWTVFSHLLSNAPETLAKVISDAPENAEIPLSATLATLSRQEK